MESWRHVWRKAATLLPQDGLEALRLALASNDKRLLQGATVMPAPLQCVQDWPVEAACPIGFCGWQDNLESVGEVEHFFARVCYDLDLAVAKPAGNRWFLNWWDETPREKAIAELLPEVERELTRRKEIAS